jgi:O-antigen/teichoic acid export membrane protein
MIARKSALIITVNILNALLGYIALYFIARYMTPEDYGIMAFAYSFVALFTIFGKMGFDQAHVKRVSEGKDLGKCIGTSITTKIGLLGIMTIVIVVAIFFWKVVMNRGFESSIHETAVYLMLGYWIIHLFIQTLIHTFRGKKEIAKAEIPLFFETFIRVAVTIYIALTGFGAIALVLAYIAGDIIFLLLSLYFFREYPIKKPTKDYFKSYSTFALPMIVVVSSTVIMTNIDKVLIQLFWSAADVGYYFAAFRLSKFINVFTIAIGMLLFPTFSYLHSKNDIPGIRRLTYQSERYLSMIVFPMALGMISLAEPTVAILLSQWIPAIPILQILPFFVLFVALERPYQSQFLGMNRPKLARNRVIIMVCCNVFFNIVLIPRDIQMLGLNLVGMGAKGAAIATVISYGVGLVYSRIMAWKYTKIKGNPRILFHAFASVVMATVLYFMLYQLNMIEFITRWYYLLAFALFGFGIYLAVLCLFKEFSKQDLIFFADALNIKKLIAYIKDEIRKN